MVKRRDVKTGERFKMFTVIEELPCVKRRIFKCKCDCGIIKNVLLYHLLKPNVKSCGCYKRKILTKHGMHNSKEYSTWENMIQRCNNPKARKYYLYGERGIKVCDRWKSFENFYEDMGSRPNNTSLDRLDNNKGYYKENCKWSTPREQLVNVRYFTQRVKYDNIVKTTEEWINLLNIDRNIFKLRILRGLTFQQALFSEVDIVVLDIENNTKTIYDLSRFLIDRKFKKEEVLKLIDSDHGEPYFGYIIRYLTGFKGFPDKYK